VGLQEHHSEQVHAEMSVIDRRQPDSGTPTPPATDAEVGVVLATICTRVRRPLRRRGLDTERPTSLPWIPSPRTHRRSLASAAP
jgi:hypothetical protein